MDIDKIGDFSAVVSSQPIHDWALAWRLNKMPLLGVAADIMLQN